MTDPTAMEQVQPLASHPAKYSPEILEALRPRVREEARRIRRERPGTMVEVLDPMAGVGRIHQLHNPRSGVWTTGVEIQPRWAACHGRTACADFMEWAGRPGNYRRFPIVATSPTYGNRYSDHHNAQDGTERHSYTHDYGEELEPNNSGLLPWGPRYWQFHADMYSWVNWTLSPGGLFLLNVSNFYRGKALVAAVDFHRGAAMGAGLLYGGRDIRIVTHRHNGVGAKATAARADHEVILRFRAPDYPPPTPPTPRTPAGED